MNYYDKYPQCPESPEVSEIGIVGQVLDSQIIQEYGSINAGTYMSADQKLHRVLTLIGDDASLLAAFRGLNHYMSSAVVPEGVKISSETLDAVAVGALAMLIAIKKLAIDNEKHSNSVLEQRF
ncbi:MAG: hypothetical protein NVSMB46_05960 [Candidatus Saccharimonadales bacterium]